MFIDRVQVKVRGGKGGDGCVSFHREKFVPLGGPDGGNGGHGGDVIFFVDPGETTLIVLHGRPWYAAQNGENGANNNKTGASGHNVRIPVPPGTVVRDIESGKVLCDLVLDSDEAVVAAGGKGGKGNTTFASSTHQTPRKATPGKPGVELTILVELKIVADIGLVGFPNAGKSTLLNAITRAHAKIGDYPFTTLHPVLGTLLLEPEEEAAILRKVGDHRDAETDRELPRLDQGEYPPLPRQASSLRSRIIVADIPGIVEGAHEGIGLGLEFLRHIERTRILLFVLDVSVNRLAEPLEAYQSLLEELRQYNASLLNKPHLVVLNKIDDPLAPEEIDLHVRELEEALGSDERKSDAPCVFPVSALFAQGLEPLRKALVRTYLNTIQT